MLFKNKIGLFAALFMLFGLMSAQAQSVVHNKAYYEAITYQWTDASGAMHTNAITDEATDPYQIVALLKKVYCDPNIPGPKYSAYDKNGNRERVVDYGAVGGGWNISASDVTAPYEEGYTILMVSVKEELSLRPNDNYGSYEFPNAATLISYIGSNIASVQLLTDGLRIGEGMHAGTAFNISGNYNRFFMLGKGQARQKTQWVLDEQGGWFNEDIYGERVPFKSMFEQFSPTDGSENSEILDFYTKMIAGDVYPVVHDCASVLQTEHYFSMAGKNGHESKSLTGLNIFIPDYRLLYWEDVVRYNNRDHTVDGRMMNPYYDINGNRCRSSRSYFEVDFAQYNPAYAPMVGLYTIKLEGNAAEGTEERTYDVTLDWTSSLNTMANGEVPQTYTVYIVLTDEYGNETYEELVVTGETTYTYTVPQDEHSYTITYIVHGQPSDGEHDMFVAWSNQASVIIPGWNDFLSLQLNHFESDYKSAEELNYYRNFLNLENDDVLNGLTRARINDGEDTFVLYRFDTNNPDVMIPVAELKLIANGNNVRYEVTYDNQEPLAGYNVNVVTSGNLGSYGQNDVIDLGAILFVDQFTASTADNTHSNRYGYMLALVGNTKTTNTVEVPVQKTASTIDGFYTLDEIMSDVDRHLDVNIKNANVEMNLANNPAIYYYTLERGDNMNPNDALSKLQRRTDGTFMEMNDRLGMAGNIYPDGVLNLLDTDVLTGIYNDFTTYVPVIWTFGTNRVNNNPELNNDAVNSYGSPIWKTGVAQITDAQASASFTAGEFVTWKDEANRLCCYFNPVITVKSDLPDYASVDYEVCMYRVWRLCDDIRNSTYDPVTGYRVNDVNADRDPDKLIVEEMTDATEVTFGDAIYDFPMANNEFGGLAYGALKDSQTAFIVRMYYKKADSAKADAPLYYVVEKTIDNWSNIYVDVNELNINNEVSKTYYNALGIPSDKPYDGVNIVVTRYSNGATTTSKLVK